MRVKRPPSPACSEAGDGDGGGRGGRPEKFEKPSAETSTPVGGPKPKAAKPEEKDPDVIPQNKGKFAAKHNSFLHFFFAFLFYFFIISKIIIIYYYILMEFY